MRRIKSQQSIYLAYQNWLLADGPRQINRNSWRVHASGRRWRDLVQAALEHEFSNSNDLAVKLHYEGVDQAAAERDRNRKRRERAKARDLGVVDDQLLADLSKAQCHRAATLVAAINEARSTGEPRQLAKLPAASVRELFDVWLGREIIRARKDRASGAAIARWIVETGRSNRSASMAALATRVSKDLARIASFEQLQFQGKVLLPPLNTKEELTLFSS